MHISAGTIDLDLELVVHHRYPSPFFNLHLKTRLLFQCIFSTLCQLSSPVFLNAKTSLSIQPRAVAEPGCLVMSQSKPLRLLRNSLPLTRSCEFIPKCWYPTQNFHQVFSPLLYGHSIYPTPSLN